jgi:uncharacterized membrane protein YfcA
MHPLVLALIIFFAIFTQSVVGFGTALIAMPLLIEGLGIQVAAPLVATLAIVIEIILLIRYRHAINLRTVGMLLGILITAYAIYALLKLRLPEIKDPRWAYGFGFAGGVLSGAYNTGGPPVVIYGTCRGWSPAEFRSNLQGYFILNSIIVIISHALAQHYTPFVWQNFLIALPAALLGLLTGISLDKYINPALFRRLVLVMLVILGLNLIF